MAVLVRRDVWELTEEDPADPWHPVLRAYALAVGALQRRPASNPTSWLYQAQVHGVGLPTDPPPDSFRSQCQHNCWYFLSWHRWYLYYFEQIIRAALPQLPEVPAAVAAAWALPYWDYSRTGSAKLPPAFRAPRLWDGTRPNPLFIGARNGALNAGTGAIPPTSSKPLPGVLTQSFSNTTGAPSFGGSASGWHHFREHWQTSGGLESVPHNVVHGLVGGPMLDFATAGRDPVFWLHHCNIDRYWEVRGHGAGKDPSGAWLTDPFNFHDATGAPKVVTSAGCVDTRNQLGYIYQQPGTPPGPGAGPMHADESPEMADAQPPANDLPPEVLAADDSTFELAGESAALTLSLDTPSDQFLAARAPGAGPRRYMLTVDDIQGDTNPEIAYEVFVGDTEPEHLVGIVSFFGLEGAGTGSSLGFTFDITDVVADLQQAGRWDPAQVDVELRPLDLDYDEGVSRADFVTGLADGVERAAPLVAAVRVGSVRLAIQ